MFQKAWGFLEHQKAYGSSSPAISNGLKSNYGSINSAGFINEYEYFNSRINETSNYLAEKLVSSWIIFNLDRDEFSKQFAESCKKLAAGPNFNKFILIEWFNRIKDNTNDEEAIASTPKSSKLDNSPSIDLKEFLSICIEFLDVFQNEETKIALANYFMQSNYLSSQLKDKLGAFVLYIPSYDNILFLQEILSSEIMKKIYFDFTPLKLTSEDSVEWLRESFLSFIKDKSPSYSALQDISWRMAMIFLLIIEKSEEEYLIQSVEALLSELPSLLKENPSSSGDKAYNKVIMEFIKLLLHFIQHLKENTYNKLKQKIGPILKNYNLDKKSSFYKSQDCAFYLEQINLVLNFINKENNTSEIENYESFQILSSQPFFNHFDYAEFRKFMDAILEKIERENSSSDSTQLAIKNEQDSAPQSNSIKILNLVSYFSENSLKFYMNYFFKFLNDQMNIENRDILDCVKKLLLHSSSLSTDTKTKFICLQKYLSAIK